MSQAKINKNTLMALIISELKQELNQAINAANAAHAEATDDESIAETQYDTLAIEASYLAEGQSRRIELLKSEIQAYQQLNIVSFINDKPIALSALVQLSTGLKERKWLFIGPAAGGFTCQLAGQTITVITPKSPLGIALMDKQQDDDVEINLAKDRSHDYIVTIQ